MEKQEINYPWQQAPHWAQWAAIDSNGHIFFFDSKPKLKHTILAVVYGRCFWAVSSGRSLYFGEYSNSENINWKLSLQKRP